MNKQTDSDLKKQINYWYLIILKRPADKSGLKHFHDRINNGNLTLAQIPKELMKSKEFKDNQEIILSQKNRPKVKKPIFIIGVPRSGTTVLYQVLCHHPDLAWLSHKDVKYWTPEAQQKKLKNEFMEMKKKNVFIPHSDGALFILGTELSNPLEGTSKIPIEADTLWKKFLEGNEKYIPILKKSQLIEIIKTVLENQKKPRFINKAPQNSLRLFSLQNCFPDAKFINLARDPKSVVSSMVVKSKKQGKFDPGMEFNEKFDEKLDFIQNWATLYKKVTEAIHEFAVKKKENFLTVFYEDLIANPKKKLEEIQRFCELEPSPVVEKAFRINEPTKTTKWKNTLLSKDVKKIFEIVDPSLQKMNYPYKP